MPSYVAFLRGINLGKRRIKMEDLRDAFTAMGLKDAQTLIASGNVLFQADDARDLVTRIESGLSERFGFEVPTILRSITALEALTGNDPFTDHPETDDTKRYVFFLADDPALAEIEIEKHVPGDYDVIARTESEIFAVAYRQPSGRFGEGLDALAKPFRTGITNRNWNTVLRMIEKARG